MGEVPLYNLNAKPRTPNQAPGAEAAETCLYSGFEVLDYRGTSLIRKRQPPWDPPRTLSIGLR